MMFLVTLIALLLERFFDWSHLRRWNWFFYYQAKIISRLPSRSPTILFISIILPLLLVVLLIQYLLYGLMFGLFEFLFQLMVFIYCLGPQNLWADIFASLRAIPIKEQQTDPTQLNVTPTPFSNAYSSSTAFIKDNIFVQANCRVFAVLFWFIVLGPVGAVFYRLVSLVAQTANTNEAAPDWMKRATFFNVMLDWLPIRLFTLLFALGGHFVKVIACWRRNDPISLNANEKLLTECGIAALGENGDSFVLLKDNTILKSAIALLDRAFVIMLVIIALSVLIF